MLALTDQEMAHLAEGRPTIFILAKLEDLSCRRLGQYLKNEDFKYFLQYIVGIKTISCKGDALPFIQAWVDEASERLIKQKPAAEVKALEKIMSGEPLFLGDNLIAL